MSLTLICKMTRLSFSIYDNPNNISLESKYARVNTTMKGLESTRESSNNQMLWQLSHLLHNYFLKISIPITKIKKKKETNTYQHFKQTLMYLEQSLSFAWILIIYFFLPAQVNIFINDLHVIQVHKKSEEHT